MIVKYIIAHNVTIVMSIIIFIINPQYDTVYCRVSITRRKQQMAEHIKPVCRWPPMMEE